MEEHAPGFAAAHREMLACRLPRQAFASFRQHSNEPADGRGIELEDWVRLAPTVGLADVLTADAMFDQLCSNDVGRGNGSTLNPAITFETFEKYARRIAEKSCPGASPVGGWIDQGSADSVLAETELGEGEVVLLAGGAPSYAIHDMITTPRTAGCLILTTHALYWRPSGLRKMLSHGVQIRRFELLPQDGIAGWVAEEHCYGPLGLGITDMALRLSRKRGGAQPSTADDAPAEHEAIFNFPLHAEQRSVFVLAIAEVVAAHAFCDKHLGMPSGVLCSAVTQGLFGSLVRYRAARNVITVVTPKHDLLPFTVIMAEPPESLLAARMAELFQSTHSRLARVNDVPAPEPEPLAEVNAGNELRHVDSIATTLRQTTASDAVANAVSQRRKQRAGQLYARATFDVLPERTAGKYQRLKHNISLTKALLRLPLLRLRTTMLQFLRWESPSQTMLLFCFVQWLAMTDRFYSYLPAISVASLYAAVWRTQRELKATRTSSSRGAANTDMQGQHSSVPRHPYRVDYWHREPGLKTKFEHLQANIEALDGLVERLVMFLLKLHSAFAGVDEECVSACYLPFVPVHSSILPSIHASSSMCVGEDERKATVAMNILTFPLTH